MQDLRGADLQRHRVLHGEAQQVFFLADHLILRRWDPIRPEQVFDFVLRNRTSPPGDEFLHRRVHFSHLYPVIDNPVCL